MPNQLPLVERELRLELPADHPFHGGIDTTMSIDQSTHSLFGVSKASADLLVQEYGRYFDMPTVRRIVHGAAASNYRLSALVQGVVRSDQFRMRRVPQAAASTN